MLTTALVISACIAGCGEKDTATNVATDTATDIAIDTATDTAADAATDVTAASEITVQTVSAAETPVPTPVEKKQGPFNNADDLLKAFFENTDDNYNSVYEVHSERTIFKNIHDPVTFIEDKKTDTDRSGNFSHRTVSVYQKANTSESNHETEVYSEKAEDSYIFYTNDTTSDEWEREEHDYYSRGEDDLLNKLHAYNEDIDPKFTYDDKKEQYELVLTGAEFLFDAPDSEDVLSSMDPMQQSYVEHMMDATANLKIHYIIDKDLHLVNIKSDDIKFNVDFEDKAIDLIGYVEYLMNVNVTYSEFGEIKATDVTVPARIKESCSESYIEDSEF